MAKFAWGVLIYNVIVVVWGVFLRASKSGDGCGRYWLTCHGEVIPSAPELKTVIEFSHRVMSGIDFFIVLGLFVAVYFFAKGHRQLRVFAGLSFFFIVTEALIGAGLVLTGNVAAAYTESRPFWAIGHLVNTFLLLGFLALTALLLTKGEEFRLRFDRKLLLLAGIGTAAIVFIGITGAIASLTNMLFPSSSLVEGITKDFAADSHILLRLRILHPFGSVLIGVFLAFVAGWIGSTYKKRAGRMPGLLALLILIQVIFGGMTILTGAPIVMQLIHLLLADAIWIVWVLLIAKCLMTDEEPSSV
ncbi:MAG: heme A synthase [Pyrinomonadaceae bacterium]|nr:heme A synthase [Pyrinomonadaceae bacterium]